jgi:OOP family OmpA-OmpF porin
MRMFGKVGVVLAAFAATVVGGSAIAGPYGFVDLYGVQHDDRTGKADPSVGVRFGAGLPIIDAAAARTSVELGIFLNPISQENSVGDDQFGGMLDLVHTFKRDGLSPFVFAGIGGVREDVVTASGLYGALEAGVGLERAMRGGEGSFRVSLSAQEVFNDEANPSQDGFLDYRLAVGFIGLGTPAPKAAPARPVDSDGDGIPDSADRCPAQPAPTSDGCPTPVAPAAPPRDTDGDGIDDSKDECPGTLEGLNVDGSGCVAAASAQKVVLKGVNFVPNSAELTPDAKTVLDEAYDALAGQTNLNVEISGHTDSQGEEKYNEALSQRRAESVRKYLSGKGIDAGRLTARGYGEGQPIADNKTKAGRQQNRRVELKILN